MEIDDLFKIPIQELENYRINKNGKIWSLHSKRFLKSRICNGYSCMTRTLSKDENGKCITKSFAIHRIIAITFLPNPNNYEIVNHINSDKLDNSLENLEWVTQKQNVNKSSKQTSHPRKVLQIKDDSVCGVFNSVSDAGKHIGLSRSAISKACLGINKSAGGYVWMYENLSHNHTTIDLAESKKIYYFENYYVFSDGKIYNSERKSYVKPVKNASGYCYVTLCKCGKKKNYYIHIIVADHFIENTKSINLQVNHKNKKRDDNRVENLEFVTCSENMKHAYQAFSTKLSEKSEVVLVNC